MSVQEVRLSFAGATGAAAGSDPTKIQDSYTARFFVKCSSSLDSPDMVLAHFRGTYSLPWIGKIFAYGNGGSTSAICKRINAQPIPKSEGCYEVEASYEPIDSEDGNQPPEQKPDVNGKMTDNPLLWADEIEVSGSTVMATWEYATFYQAQNAPGGLSPLLRPGKFMHPMNSAGDLFDPPPDWEVDCDVLRITKFVDRFDGQMFGAFRGAVNTDHVRIDKPDYKFKYEFGPQTGRFRLAACTFGQVNGIKYFRRTCEIHINPLGWRRPLLDRGLNRRAAAGDRDAEGNIISASEVPQWVVPVRPITDPEGYTVSQPVNLDGNGAPLEAHKDPVYLEYGFYHETAFAGLAGKAW
jgi:hypothetical protein